MEKCIAIITARGASKRIPRKNLNIFCGVPIIKYSIDAAIKAGCFDEIMVSTDDKEIADISIYYGAKVPFYRSYDGSMDTATTADVIEDVLLEYKKLNKEYKYCCCIYPTAPFISSDRLREGLDILENKGADSVLPVVRFSYPVQRALRIEGGRLKMVSSENINTRSQDLEPLYHDCGQFYWLRTDKFLNSKKIFMENTVPIEVSVLEAQDIDNMDDWKIAEIKYKILKNI